MTTYVAERMRRGETCRACGRKYERDGSSWPAHMTNRRSGVTHEAVIHSFTSYESSIPEVESVNTLCSGQADEPDRWFDDGGCNRVTCKRCLRMNRVER